MNDDNKLELMRMLKEWGFSECFIFNVILCIDSGMSLGVAIDHVIQEFDREEDELCTND